MPQLPRLLETMTGNDLGKLLWPEDSLILNPLNSEANILPSSGLCPDLEMRNGVSCGYQ